MCIIVPLLPWWALFLCASLYVIFYSKPYEIVIPAVFFDLLYTVRYDLFFPATGAIIVLIVLASYIKPHIALFSE